MSQTEKMKKVWVLGAGQLGAMLRQAGNPIGLDVRPIAATQSVDDLAELALDDVVTPEIEAWESAAITDQLAAHANFINRDVFPVIADRLTQKQSLDDFGVATAKWLPVEAESSAEELRESLGDSVLLKRRRGGYDGRGQHWLRDQSAIVPEDFKGESIAEQAIPFTAEISIIGVRNQQGETRFYPVSQNHHVNGILKATIGASEKYAHLQAAAEKMLSKVLEGFNYIGVMAMECFIVNDDNGKEQLLVNELAPRVHNSGHWTQAGSSISQFESHLRAVTNLPLGQPSIKGLSVMINLVGVDYDLAWLDVSGAEIYWYGKDVRAGRKLGHINFCQPQTSALKQLATLMPEEDQQVFDWVLEQLPENELN